MLKVRNTTKKEQARKEKPHNNPTLGRVLIRWILRLLFSDLVDFIIDLVSDEFHVETGDDDDSSPLDNYSFKDVADEYSEVLSAFSISPI